MAVLIPTTPMGSTYKPRYVPYGQRLTAPLGGSTQNIMRLGDRWAFDVTMPPMTEAVARPIIAAYLEALATGQTVRLRVPQLDGPSPVGFVGVVNATNGTINGGGIGGVKQGMWFSVIADNGWSYLHQVTSVSSTLVNVAPRLRASFNTVSQFAAPVIEGWLETPFEWSVEIAQIIGLSCSITEAR
jgi:hypothetical protein